jgi:hypothetical protein
MECKAWANSEHEDNSRVAHTTSTDGRPQPYPAPWAARFQEATRRPRLRSVHPKKVHTGYSARGHQAPTDWLVVVPSSPPATQQVRANASVPTEDTR